MAKKFKAVTITLPEETIVQFKDFCSKNQLPFSRFLCYAGIRFIEKENQTEVPKHD
jgi:hypothetical protein